MDWNRRRMLKAAGALVGTGALWSGPALADPVRAIALRNVHTGESLELEYFHGGAYVPAALAAIEGLLRDVRNDERGAVDPKLLDYLVDTAATVGARPAYRVISGFRSRTGERSHNLHMQGRAIDVCLSGVDSAALAAGAESLKRGGVGLYRASNFVHLDTGAFRTWRG